MRANVYQGYQPYNGNETLRGYVETNGSWQYVSQIQESPSDPPQGVFWKDGRLAGIVVPMGKFYAHVYIKMNGRVDKTGMIDDSVHETETQDVVNGLSMYVYSSGTNDYRHFQNEIGSVVNTGREGIVYGRFVSTDGWSGTRTPVGVVRPHTDVRIMAGAAMILLFLAPGG